jgi:hypothetical protein
MPVNAAAILAGRNCADLLNGSRHRRHDRHLEPAVGNCYRHPGPVRQPAWTASTWPARHAILLAVLWPALLTFTFLPLSARQYRIQVSDQHRLLSPRIYWTSAGGLSSGGNQSPPILAPRRPGSCCA